MDAWCPGLKLVPGPWPPALSRRRVLAGVWSLTTCAITTWQLAVTFHCIACGISRGGGDGQQEGIDRFRMDTSNSVGDSKIRLVRHVHDCQLAHMTTVQKQGRAEGLIRPHRCCETSSANQEGRANDRTGKGLAGRKLPTFPCFAAVASTLHSGSNVLRLPGSGLITSAGARSARLVHLGGGRMAANGDIWSGAKSNCRGERRVRDLQTLFRVRKRKI